MQVCKAVSYLKDNIYGLFWSTVPVNNEHVLIPGIVRFVIPTPISKLEAGHSGNDCFMSK